MHVLVEEHPKPAIESRDVEEGIVEVLRLVLEFFEDGGYEPVVHKVTVDKPSLTTVVQLDEADFTPRVEESIPFEVPVGLYIQSHLRGRLRPLQAPLGTLFGVGIVECPG